MQTRERAHCAHSVFPFIKGEKKEKKKSGPVSYRILSKSNYYSGPYFLCKETKTQEVEAISVTIPNPHARNTDKVSDVGNETNSILYQLFRKL